MLVSPILASATCPLDRLASAATPTVLQLSNRRELSRWATARRLV